MEPFYVKIYNIFTKTVTSDPSQIQVFRREPTIILVQQVQQENHLQNMLK